MEAKGGSAQSRDMAADTGMRHGAQIQEEEAAGGGCRRRPGEHCAC